VVVDEARRVIERIGRIERLRDGGGSKRALIAELRKLLEEGEAWLAVEPDGTERARAALDRCRRRLFEREDPLVCPPKSDCPAASIPLVSGGVTRV
jgi:hypothetical protein